MGEIYKIITSSIYDYFIFLTVLFILMIWIIVLFRVLCKSYMEEIGKHKYYLLTHHMVSSSKSVTEEDTESDTESE
jgi:hypothetical protein